MDWDKVLPTVAVESRRCTGDRLAVGSRQHPKSKNGVAFVTTSTATSRSSSGPTWPGAVGARCVARLLVKGVVSRHDGTPNVIVSGLKAIDTRVRMPEAHDWY